MTLTKIFKLRNFNFFNCLRECHCDFNNTIFTNLLPCRDLWSTGGYSCIVIFVFLSKISNPADFEISFAYCQKIWSRIVFTAAGGMVNFLSWRQPIQNHHHRLMRQHLPKMAVGVIMCMGMAVRALPELHSCTSGIHVNEVPK